MLRFTIVLMFVALVRAGDEFSCCSIEDREEIQAMWSRLWTAGNTGIRIAVAQAVFEDLFERDPDAKNVFVNVNVEEFNSPEFRAHSLRVINGLDTIFGLFDDVKTLQLQLDHLGKQHAAMSDLGVKAEYFDTIGRSLQRVLPQVAGCFNMDAFTRCYGGISKKLGSYF